ncbi:hypothetical protein JCM33374_g5571 [Metschnikowia sp. JCM 33374]|nr:hypothetical protein JCM33374_g5571 [Metschnikowia sp. JCM 33374]
MQEAVKVDGKVRTDSTFPAGFMDVITLRPPNENFRIDLRCQGRFTVSKNHHGGGIPTSWVRLRRRLANDTVKIDFGFTGKSSTTSSLTPLNWLWSMVRTWVESVLLSTERSTRVVFDETSRTRRTLSSPDNLTFFIVAGYDARKARVSLPR